MNSFALSRNRDVIGDQVDGEMVLCSLATGEFFRMNKVGLFIWEICEGSSVNSIVDRVESTFSDGDPNVIRSNVSDFISSLIDMGLLDKKEAGSGELPDSKPCL